MIIAVLQISLLALWASHTTARTQLTLASSVLAVVSTLALAVFSTFEHSRDIKPSAVIQTFLLVITVLELPRVRTEWFMPENLAVASIFTAVFVLRLPLLALESWPKASHARQDTSKLSPVEGSGIFGSSLLLWVLPLLRAGYGRDLSLEELYPVDQELRGKHLTSQLGKVWETSEALLPLCPP